MKALTIAIFIVLVAGAFAQEEETMNIINKMENSQFGKTLMDTIQLQLEAGDPVSDLIQLLNDMEDDIRAEQDEDDEFIYTFQTQCDDDLARIQATIEAANNRIQELTELLARKIPEREQKLVELREKNDYLTMIETEITALDGRKDLKDQEWAEEQEQHNRAQFAIERAREIIVSATQSSFLQKKGGPNTALVQMSDTITQSIKQYTYKRKSWTRLFSMLASIASSAPVQSDQSAVQTIVELCNDILDKIAESREIERRDYQHWINEFNTYRGGLTDRAAQTTDQIHNLESEISTLNAIISRSQEEKQSLEEKVEQKTTEHDERLRICDDENVAYSERRQSRDDRRGVVSDAIGLLQSKLRTFRKYVNDRTSTVTRAH